MADLNHYFYLIRNEELKIESFYINYVNKKSEIKIHDDLIEYFWDSIKCIEFYNPAVMENCKGLCRCGVTVIDKAGNNKLISIVDTWIEIINTFPDDFFLHELPAGNFNRCGYKENVEIPFKKAGWLGDCNTLKNGLLRIDKENLLLHLGI